MFKFFRLTLLQLLFFCDYGYGQGELSSEFNEWLLTQSPVRKDLIDAATEVNQLCTKLHFETPQSLAPIQQDIRFVLMTPSANYTYSMEQAGEIVQNPAFNKNWSTTIFSSGWQSSFNGSNAALFGISNAFLCAGNINFIAIDFADYLETTVFFWGALNTAAIGKFAAIGIEKLSLVYPIEKIRLLGHSFGGQVVGAAARHFTKLTNKMLPRITGLDPARACFENNPRLPTIHSGDAKFVDIIHTDPGIYGFPYPIGDVDFYPNGLNPIPTGCRSVMCAHYRSWEYYAESLYPGNKYGFMAVNCTSEKDFKTGMCTGQKYPMGYACPTGITGIMYLDVNNVPPYGLNSISPSKVKCAPGYSSNSKIIF